MKERRVLAIGSPKRTILGWTVSFLNQSTPARTKIIEGKVSGWQLDLENRGTDSIREPRSPEPEDTDLTCLPDPNKTRYHPREAGRSYGAADGIYHNYLDTDWNLNPWYPFRNAKDFELGCWMLKSGLTKGSIDEYLQCRLDDNRCILFQTADKL